MSAEGLVQVLKQVAPFSHPWIDPNVGSMEDAALLRPEAGPPLAFTVDFITPVVDDPEAFGAIAAANALSDIYAMGGDPQIALAVCGVPEDLVPLEVLGRIFRGGSEKAAEAGCAIGGGHTVIDPELKYGLCVLGTVPGQPLTQTGARPGDRLVLTKPIGFGVAAQAIKKQQLPAADIERVVSAMSMLNRDAKDAALAAGATAATDVTGFGLLGHLNNLLKASKHAARLYADAVPIFDFVPDLVSQGFVPGGSRNNLSYVEATTSFADSVSEEMRLVLADAQTSGGLLLAVAPERESQLIEELEGRGTLAHSVIGEVLDGRAGHIDVLSS